MDLEELAEAVAFKIHLITMAEPSGATRTEHRNELLNWFVTMVEDEFE